MNNELDDTPTLGTLASAAENCHSKDHSILIKFLDKKMANGLCYLQFSAINSQLKKNKAALGSAQNALSIFNLVLEECDKYEGKLS